MYSTPNISSITQSRRISRWKALAARCYYSRLILFIVLDTQSGSRFFYIRYNIYYNRFSFTVLQFREWLLAVRLCTELRLYSSTRSILLWLQYIRSAAITTRQQFCFKRSGKFVISNNFITQQPSRSSPSGVNLHQQVSKNCMYSNKNSNVKYKLFPNCFL